MRYVMKKKNNMGAGKNETSLSSCFGALVAYPRRLQIGDLFDKSSQKVCFAWVIQYLKTSF